ncbi:MAG: NAD(P)H-hydrate dehydratase [Tannerella sp.]|jgi:NAD(P)H-hydrate epimerase|nr:NAD(P)H-hydrate dehydratase [Tannerella sp.]
MKKIFETSKIKEIDGYTVENEPIESIDFVERAATVFVNEFCRKFTSHAGKIYVFAGPGNNGADALAIARLLADNGYNIFAYLINPDNSLSRECEINKRRFKESYNENFTEEVKEPGVEKKKFTPPKFEPQDIVIDGLFGSGLNRPLEGLYAAIVSKIINSKRDIVTVVSIDMPSGLFGEDNKANNPENVVYADYTFTFEYPKLSFLFPETGEYIGEWKELSIGVHPDAVNMTKTPYCIITEEDVSSLLVKRDKFSHKGDYGHALLIAGGQGKIGAAVLAAKACMRSGAGLLTAHIPSYAEAVLPIAVPEVMLSLDYSETNNISALPVNSRNQPSFLSKFSAIGIGPGIGTQPETVAMITQLFKDIREMDSKPNLVIDADALNIIADDSQLLDSIPESTIITPHVKEFDRLAGSSETGYERLQKAREFAKQKRIFVILKGAYTAVCIPSGNVYFNMTGNPGMATAGSGDVLTGIILGLLAQDNYTVHKATAIGVHLHGLAGDLAAKALSQDGMKAGDIIDYLPMAFRQMQG